MVGKSPWLQSVHVETDAPIGSLTEVDIVEAGPNSLRGFLCPGEGRGPGARDSDLDPGLRRGTQTMVAA
jgi:hypothetical protein